MRQPEVRISQSESPLLLPLLHNSPWRFGLTFLIGSFFRLFQSFFTNKLDNSENHACPEWEHQQVWTKSNYLQIFPMREWEAFWVQNFDNFASHCADGGGVMATKQQSDCPLIIIIFHRNHTNPNAHIVLSENMHRYLSFAIILNSEKVLIH